MKFFPHDPRGKNVHALYQSLKWQEELSRETRVQMVSSLGKHYYIFEPVTLKRPSQPIVIPIFFYQMGSRVYSKCIKPQYMTLKGSHSVPKQLVMYIPGQIDFNSEGLLDIPVEDFDLIYSEIFTADGEYLAHKCQSKIVGE